MKTLIKIFFLISILFLTIEKKALASDIYFIDYSKYEPKYSR